MIARRVRSAWAGEWSALWRESAQAAHVPGSGFSRTDAQTMAADIREIERAIADGDERGALKRLDGPLRLATSAVAARELPKLFPQAEQPLPEAVRVDPDAGDVSSFLAIADSTSARVPRRRGPGPGGARCEHWHFGPEHEDHWRPLRLCWLDLALGRIPGGVMQAVASARVLTGDKGDENVRPCALGHWVPSHRYI